MIIGIDLRVLQSGHKFRGIGEVAKQVTERIMMLASKDAGIEFVFYEYADNDDPKELLMLPEGLRYTVAVTGLPPEKDHRSGLQKLGREFQTLFGNPVGATKQCDVFLQFDYSLGVPKDTKTVLVKHDIIPFIFWSKHFTSPSVHIRNKALRTTLRTAYDNYKALRVVRRALKNAHYILTVSTNTKQDLKRYFQVKEQKMAVIPLGVSTKPAKTTDSNNQTLPAKPYLLFVGGIDLGPRRAVHDIVAAFNNLKAQGHDIALVLVGENFASADSIPVPVVREAIEHSSYRHDILTLGYIDDVTKHNLYRNALAFVFPTKYEGFGIPILEAMLLDCPVIAYKNSSIPEVGGKHILYATNWEDIKKQVETLLAMPLARKRRLVADAKAHAETFTWDKTAAAIYEELLAAARK